MIEVKDCKFVWANCLKVIKEMVGDQSFKTWFEPIVPLSIYENVITIQVPSRFFYEWLEEHYIHVLKDALHAELGSTARLEYAISNEGKTAENNKLYNINLQSTQKTGGKTLESNGSRASESTFSFDVHLQPQYQFDNFIEGDCNRLARSSGFAVAKKPGATSFNPLMLYGKVGLGKTHLVQAIGNYIRQHHEGKSILYVSAEKFCNQYIEAVKTGSIREFSNFFLKSDVLVLDDIQFFANKEKTQETFFHIFNDLHQSGRQIIMTSDKAPKDLVGFQERLLSRFKWGLTADLQAPDFETRVAIIQKKLEIEAVTISPEVLEYLAYSIDTNIREIEGVINNLIAQSSLNQRQIDLELAKQAIQTIVQNVDAEVGIDYIMKFVSEYFSVSIEQMKDKTRKREIVVARQVSMYFAKEYTNMSLKSIGSNFGNRDHSTVIHAIQSVNDLMDTDKKFNATMQDLIKRIKLKAI